LFIDGVQHPGTIISTSGSSQFGIARYLSDSLAGYDSANLDNFQFYQRELSVDDVAYLYSASNDEMTCPRLPSLETTVGGGAVAGGSPEIAFKNLNFTPVLEGGGAVAGGKAILQFAEIDGYVPLLAGEISAYVTNAAQFEGIVPRLWADVSTTGAFIDGFIPLLEADISAQHTMLSAFDGMVPMLYADIETQATGDCILDGLVPALYADISATSGATCSIDGYVPRLYADIEALKTSGAVDGIVPMLLADIRAEASDTDDILSFQPRPTRGIEATHEMNIPLLHATITADAGESYVLGFVRGDWQ
jgi:hypothetical protein